MKQIFTITDKKPAQKWMHLYKTLEPKFEFKTDYFEYLNEGCKTIYIRSEYRK